MCISIYYISKYIHIFKFVFMYVYAQLLYTQIYATHPYIYFPLFFYLSIVDVIPSLDT